jgi:hypothetical protein
MRVQDVYFVIAHETPQLPYRFTTQPPMRLEHVCTDSQTRGLHAERWYVPRAVLDDTNYRLDPALTEMLSQGQDPTLRSVQSG